MSSAADCLNNTTPSTNNSHHPLRPPCPSCGANVGILSRTGPHVRADCSICGQWCSWIPKRKVPPAVLAQLFLEAAPAPVGQVASW